jgi:hypothetical protein
VLGCKGTEGPALTGATCINTCTPYSAYLCTICAIRRVHCACPLGIGSSVIVIKGEAWGVRRCRRDRGMGRVYVGGGMVSKATGAVSGNYSGTIATAITRSAGG